MKLNFTGQKASKIFRITIISIAGLIVAGGVSIYLLLHNYIQKMNLVNPDETGMITADMDKMGEAEVRDKTDGAADNSTATDQGNDNYLQEADTRVGYPVMGNLNDWLEKSAMYNQQAKSAQYSQDQHSEKKNQEGSSEAGQYGQKKDGEKSSNRTLMEDNEIINLLLIGIDSYKNDGSASSSSVLFTVNKKAGKIITTSLSNSAYLKLPNHSMGRLISAFETGGAASLSDTIEQNFYIKLNGYVMTDYLAYIDIVNTIGGVTMEVAKDELEPVNLNIRTINEQIGDKTDADLLLKEGTILLNGKQALAYSRNWYSKKGKFIGPGKQKDVVLSIFNKIKKLSFGEINSFLNTILPQITTNLSENQIMELILMLPVYSSYDMEQWSIPVPGTYNKIKKDGSTMLELDLESNIDAIHKKLYDIK